MIDRRTRRTEPDLIGQLEMAALARDGLQSLARETGGKMLIGTNKLSEIFDRVATDASGYYVVSYYPVDLRSAGRFRALKVSVKRPDAKVLQATKGYYETRSTSLLAKDDRGLALRQAMQRVDVPLESARGGVGRDVRQRRRVPRAGPQRRRARRQLQPADTRSPVPVRRPPSCASPTPRTHGCRCTSSDGSRRRSTSRIGRSRAAIAPRLWR